MDKRSFFFVLSLSLSLLLINTFFSNRRLQRQKEWKQQTETIRATKKEEARGELLKLESLPLKKVFSTLTSQQALAMAWQGKECLLFPTHSPLEKIWHQEGQRRKAYSLLAHQAGWALYGNENSSLPSLPLHSSKIHLLSFLPKAPFVLPSLALQENKQLSFPLGIPSSPSLLCISSGNTVLPAAFYHQGELQLLSDLDRFAPFLKANSHSPLPSAEKHYLLENEYQQLIFSSRGASLVEINLPFSKDADSYNSVREISIDRQLHKEAPHTQLFPQAPIKNSQRSGSYYPLLRRSQTARQPALQLHSSPSHRSEEKERVYTLLYQDKHSIAFETEEDFIRIVKRFSFDPQAPYCINLEIQIDGNNRDFWLSTGLPEVELISGRAAPSLKYHVTRYDDKKEVSPISLPQSYNTLSSVYPDWICNSNGFFALILDPLASKNAGYSVERISGEDFPSRISLLSKKNPRFAAEKFPGYQAYLPLKNGGGLYNFRLFAGPLDGKLLTSIDDHFYDPQTNYKPHYSSCQSFHGWFAFISQPFAKLLYLLLTLFYSLTHSWALSIVLLTIALRAILYPLSSWSLHSMKNMHQLSPQVNQIRERYKKDPKRLQAETMALYKQHKVSPLSGCLPLIIQMPFLIGMFDLLKSNFSIRGASFIPAWIDDLAAPDILFSWDKPLPYIGNELHLLPLILGLVMFFQQKLSASYSQTKAPLTEQQEQQRFMAKIMSFVFVFMFYHFPSGLCIYWLSSMLLGMLQQVYIYRSVQPRST